MAPEISLITATYGRTAELEKLLESLLCQTFKNFELIIVDQNEHFMIKKMVENYSNKITINYIRNTKKGLSLNRNLGLKYAKGSIYGFPDDDCFYDDTILECVHNHFLSNEIKCLCFNIYDTNNMTFCWHNMNAENFKRNKLYNYCISTNFFIKANNISFDEQLGIGGAYGSGEETDYLFANISNNDICKVSSSGKIYHPYVVTKEKNYEKIYKYACGFGAICKKDFIMRKHISSFFLFLKYLFRALLGILIKKDKKMYLLYLTGRFNGFNSYKIKDTK